MKFLKYTISIVIVFVWFITLLSFFYLFYCLVDKTGWKGVFFTTIIVFANIKIMKRWKTIREFPIFFKVRAMVLESIGDKTSDVERIKCRIDVPIHCQDCGIMLYYNQDFTLTCCNSRCEQFNKVWNMPYINLKREYIKERLRNNKDETQVLSGAPTERDTRGPSRPIPSGGSEASQTSIDIGKYEDDDKQ